MILVVLLPLLVQQGSEDGDSLQEGVELLVHGCHALAEHNLIRLSMLSSSWRRFCWSLRAGQGYLVILLLNLLVSADVASSVPCLHSLQGCVTESTGCHT
jgi:hypothetical protein